MGIACRTNSSIALCVVYVAVIGSGATSLADGPSDNARNVVSIIERLASRNPRPLTRLGPRGHLIDFPKDYDHEATARIAEAVQDIIALEAAAFPQLILHLNDNRFSFLRDVGNGNIKVMSVGSVCRDILKAQVNAYEVYLYPEERSSIMPDYFLEVVAKGDIRDAAAIQQWYRNASKQSLSDIQLTSASWAYSQKCKLGFDIGSESRRIGAGHRLFVLLLERSGRPYPVERLYSPHSMH